MNSKELLFDSFAHDYVTIGKLRFRRYRDLLGAEAAELEMIQREMTQASLQMMTLAKRVADAKDIPFAEAFEMLANNIAGDPELLADFADDALMLITTIPRQTKFDDEMITIFIRSRAEIETPEDGWKAFEDWDIEDTRKLPAKFRQQIREFIEQEQAGETPEEAKVKKAPKAASVS